MSHTATPRPGVPPAQTEKEVEETINPESEVDEASFESFPASDPPGVLGQRVGPAEVAKQAPEDDAPDEEE